jgi:predicted dehydrogenase
MKPVIWGVLSLSGHYRLRIHPNVSKSPLVTLRGIASRARERAESGARDLGFPKAYGSYEELLADREIEAVYIPLPNHLHAEWVMKAADAGKHVLCEKPFALNAAEAEKAIRHAERAGVLVMEAFMYRLHPQWKRARQIITAGEIGEIATIHTLFSYMNKDPRNIRNILEVGGGAIPDIGCYAVSSARFLLGREPTRVMSLVRRDPELRTDVLSSAILDFGRARSVFTVSTQSHPAQSVEVLGSGGSLTIPLPFNAYADTSAQISVTTGLGTRVITQPVTDQYVEMFEGFSRAVRKEGPLPTPSQDAINNMKVLDAIFRSEKSESWERVE